MILSGREIMTRQLVSHVRSATMQQQPCGIDLTLRRVSEWTSAAQIDLDNVKRRAATVRNLAYDGDTITLTPGAYLVDFNESIQVPLNCMASIYPRSSLWRSGVGVFSGLIDAGYQGAIGALLDVKNPHGVILHKDSKLAQVVFMEMDEVVEGYKGVYQSSTSSVGVNGTTTA